MKKFIFVIVLVLLICDAYAQHDSLKIDLNNRNSGHGFVYRSAKNKALVIINDKVILNHQVITLIDPEDILDVKVLNGAAATKSFGTDGKSGAIIILLKPKIKLLDLNKILKKFGINKNNRQLELYINDEKVAVRPNFFAHKNWISYIEVVDGPTEKVSAKRYLKLVAKERTGVKL